MDVTQANNELIGEDDLDLGVASLQTRIEDEELPEITDNEMAFCYEFLRTGNATGSYRNTMEYPEGISDVALYERAVRLKRQPNVKIWLDALREAGAENAVVTLSSHLSELNRLKEFAIKCANPNAAIRAEELRGKVAGHYVERVHHTHHEDVSDADLVAMIGALFGDDFAEQAKIKLGMLPDPKLIEGQAQDVDSSG